MRPLLLIDVDGPLNPYLAKPTKRPEGYDTHRILPTGHYGKPYRVWLNPGHGPMLLDFANRFNVELAWATTWEHDANSLIGPKIGLPELPVIKFGWEASKWKFNAVADFSKDRAMAWIDDDFKRHPEERAWFEYQRTEPTLLHWIDPAIGLTYADLETIGRWVDAL